jgi:trimeric autotransporter adhesin
VHTAKALANDAISLGENSLASGQKSASLASNAKAQTQYAVAIGHSSGVLDNAEAGVALGLDAKVENDAISGVAIGHSAKCDRNGIEAIAIGRSSNAQALETVAIGSNGKGEERARLWFCFVCLSFVFRKV